MERRVRGAFSGVQRRLRGVMIVIDCDFPSGFTTFSRNTTN